MSIRTIMIFPEFENMEVIDDIRNKYDPLAQLVRPHITLVFPFENDTQIKKSISPTASGNPLMYLVTSRNG